MRDIYNIDEFDYSEVLNKIDKLKDDIEEERAKNDDEYSAEKEFNLVYKQFMEGLKLNTGIKIFY